MPFCVQLLHLDPWTCGQSQTLALAGALCAEGWDARIVCRDNSPLYHTATARSLAVHALPERGVVSLAMLWAFFRALGSLPKDTVCLVHACDPAASKLAAVAGRLKKSLRLLHTRRGVFTDTAKNAVSRYLHPEADVVTDSEAAADSLYKAGLAGARMHVIACGLDGAGYKAHTPRNDGRFVLGVTGALTEDKGHLGLFDTLPLLAAKADMPPWELRVLGQGPLFHNLLAEAETKGVDRYLAFLGGQNSSDQLPLCDALVLPASGGESCIPLILQGWACGVPVVAVMRPEYAAYLKPGENCLAVPPNDRYVMADALLRLARSPELCEKLRRAGLASLARYSCGAMVSAHMSLYGAVLSR